MAGELYYIDPRDQIMSVEIKDGWSPEPSAAKVLFEFNGGAKTFGYYSFDVSADGQRFLILTPSEFPRIVPLHVVLNWTAGFEALTEGGTGHGHPQCRLSAHATREWPVLAWMLTG